jgi:hypothetical protein
MNPRIACARPGMFANCIYQGFCFLADTVEPLNLALQQIMASVIGLQLSIDRTI